MIVSKTPSLFRQRLSACLIQGCSLIFVSALLLGCGEQGATQKDGFREQEQALERTEASDAANIRQTAPSLSVEELMQVAAGESDAAYQAMTSRARAEGLGSELRAAFEATAEEEFSTRQMMLIVLGDVGGDEEVPFLTTLAVQDRGEPDGEVMVDEDEEQIYERISRYSERSVLRRAAVYSVAAIARRESSVAMAALGQIIDDAADPEMAQSAAYELHSRGQLSKAHKAILTKKGIPHGFQLLDTEKLMQLPEVHAPTNLQPLAHP